MKTKTIPVMITLFAVLVTCIMAFLNETGMEQLVKILLSVMIGFYILGSILRFILDKNFNPREKDGLMDPTQEESESQAQEQEKSEESQETEQTR